MQYRDAQRYCNAIHNTASIALVKKYYTSGQ
jgi:hypothetical protein